MYLTIFMKINNNKIIPRITMCKSKQALLFDSQFGMSGPHSVKKGLSDMTASSKLSKGKTKMLRQAFVFSTPCSCSRNILTKSF